VGGDDPSYHCARLRSASNGVSPTPKAMRLNSRRSFDSPETRYAAPSLDGHSVQAVRDVSSCAIVASRRLSINRQRSPRKR